MPIWYEKLRGGLDDPEALPFEEFHVAKGSGHQRLFLKGHNSGLKVGLRLVNKALLLQEVHGKIGEHCKRKMNQQASGPSQRPRGAFQQYNNRQPVAPQVRTI
uniref:Uncharacterized protein n=1 Tax=Oryza punctata TaxID=4537 RepID=A0A0E0LJB0_ORYPU